MFMSSIHFREILEFHFQLKKVYFATLSNRLEQRKPV